MNINKLDEPLDFHMEKLAEEYGYIELLHSMINLLQTDSEYIKIVKTLETARNEFGNIISKKNKDSC